MYSQQNEYLTRMSIILNMLIVLYSLAFSPIACRSLMSTQSSHIPFRFDRQLVQTFKFEGLSLCRTNANNNNKKTCRVAREEGKHISPAQTLVGFSGKLLSRKLKPLRRSRSDKIREKALEQDYLDKVRLGCTVYNFSFYI